MHTVSSYRGNRHCPPAVCHRQDRLQYTVPLCLARSVIYIFIIVAAVLLDSLLKAQSFDLGFKSQMSGFRLLPVNQKLCWNAAGVTEYNSL